MRYVAPAFLALLDSRASSNVIVGKSTVPVLIVALSPLLALVGVLVQMDAPGAVLFHQERVGTAGQRFSIYKFRSMVVDAETRLKSSVRDMRAMKAVLTRYGAF